MSEVIEVTGHDGNKFNVEIAGMHILHNDPDRTGSVMSHIGRAEYYFCKETPDQVIELINAAMAGE